MKEQSDMATKQIQDIEGIGPAYGEKLAGAGVKTADDLLERGCARKGRDEIAAACGLPASQILKWVNMADLFRIKGVGSEYAELLECAGVDTVKELRNRNAANLTKAMADANAENNLTRRVPNEDMVTTWIAEAKELPPRVEH